MSGEQDPLQYVLTGPEQIFAQPHFTKTAFSNRRQELRVELRELSGVLEQEPVGGVGLDP